MMLATCRFGPWGPHPAFLILFLLNLYEVVLALDRGMNFQDYHYCKFLSGLNRANHGK